MSAAQMKTAQGETTIALTTLDEIREAQKLVYSLMQPTPQIQWPLLSKRLDADVWVKHENHAPTNSFKIRNALSAMTRLPVEDRRRGVVAASTARVRGSH